MPAPLPGAELFINFIRPGRARTTGDGAKQLIPVAKPNRTLAHFGGINKVNPTNRRPISPTKWSRLVNPGGWAGPDAAQTASNTRFFGGKPISGLPKQKERKMHMLACKDLGVDCNYRATADTPEAVKKATYTHANDVHKDMVLAMTVEEMVEFRWRVNRAIKPA